MSIKPKHAVLALLTIITTLFAFTTPSTINAQCDPSQDGIDLSECFALNNNKTVAEVYNKPSDIINIIIANLFTTAGILVFIFFIGAGITMIATEKSKSLSQLNTILASALGGLGVMFAAYLVVQIIESITGSSIF